MGMQIFSILWYDSEIVPVWDTTGRTSQLSFSNLNEKLSFDRSYKPRTTNWVLIYYYFHSRREKLLLFLIHFEI